MFTLTYDVTHTLQVTEYIATGDPGPKTRSVVIPDVSTGTPDVREAIEYLFGLEMGGVPPTRGYAGSVRALQGVPSAEWPPKPKFEREMMPDEARRFLVRRAAEIKTIVAQYLEAEKQAKREAQEHQKQDEELAKATMARLEAGDLETAQRWEHKRPNRTSPLYPVAERARQLLKDHAHAAKDAWIRANGSPHLQRAWNAGYDCQRAYVTERARQEYPDATVDFDKTSRYSDRPMPSAQAMDIADKHPGAVVVWLRELYSTQSSPEGAEDLYDREAVLISSTFLGRYRLFQIV